MENPEEQEVIKLLKENLETSQETLHAIRKIQRYMFWQRVLGWIYFFLIIGPIIVALIYLPPLLKDAMGKYQNFLLQLETGQTLSPEDLQKIVPNMNLDELLKKQTTPR